MIVLKFTKTSSSALAAHVDTIRTMTYIVRRANLPAEYSQGFNPHIELGFSPPLPLGVESLCEYVSVKTYDIGCYLSKLNEVCPTGITFQKQWNCKVNLAATINSCLYKVQANGIGNVIDEITAFGYTISYVERGEVVQKEVSSKILSANAIDENTAEICLCVGNENLRPDRVVLHLMNKHNLQGDYNITKIRSFVNGVDADEYLDLLQQSQQKA